MAGNNSIQILRGSNVKTNSSINQQTLLAGQPLYDKATGYLYVGDGNTIANTDAVKAGYANSAGSATTANRVDHNLRLTVGGTSYVFNGSDDTNVSISTSGGDADYATNANYANYAGYATSSGSAASANRLTHYLYFNGNGSNASWNGSANDTIYVPTSVGSIGQVWGVASNGEAAWIAQTEVPGTIDHANTANTANYANFANIAYNVSGSNVSGSVASAEYADEAGSVSHSLALIMPGSTVSYNGSSTVTANIIQAFACVIGDATANMVTTNTDQTITGMKTFNNPTIFKSPITINSGSTGMILSANYINCAGNRIYMNGSAEGNVMTWSTSTSSFIRGQAALGEAIGAQNRCKLITAWMDCTSTSPRLIIADNSTSGQELASATGTAGQRICVSCLVLAGTAAIVNTRSPVWYTCVHLS